MQQLGAITVGSTDLFKDLGPLSLGEGDDTIWLRITQTSPVEDWTYSYGLVSFLTDAGAELGVKKVYGNLLGQVFPLGVGRSPSFRTGIIRFTPRAYNLRWLDAKGAPKWSLSFEYETGTTASFPGGDRTAAVVGSLADFADTRTTFAFVRLTKK